MPRRCIDKRSAPFLFARCCNNVIVRILFVTSRVPGREHRGDQLRAYQHIVGLSGRHEITLLALDSVGASRDVDQQLTACCKQVIIIRHTFPVMALHALQALWTGRPLQVEAFNMRQLHVALNRCLSSQQFDLLHVQLVRLGALVEATLPIPVVVDFVDALSMNMLRRSVHDRGPMRWLAKFEAKRLAKYERVVSAAASAATVSSAVDQNELGAGAHLHQVDNGVDIDRFPFATGDRRPFDLVFVGNLGYFPNVDAMSWFITMVLPRLVVKFPSIRLNLVGARPARSLKRFAEHVPQVQLVGVVPDVHPHFASATLAIAPLRAGSGQQLKVLEAMASGTPVVVSGVTARGLAAVDGQDLLVADGVEATVNAISRLLNDPDLRRELAINARKLVERQYTWGRSGTKLERVWQLTARAAIG